MTFHVEFEAKTTDEAVEKACKELKVAKGKLKYDVLSHGSSGIFGLVGVKKARIRVALDKAPTSPDKHKTPSKKGEKKPAAKPGKKKKQTGTKPREDQKKPAEANEPPQPGSEKISTPEPAPVIEPDKAVDPELPDADPPAPEIDMDESVEAARLAISKMACAITSEAETAAVLNPDGDILINIECEQPAVMIGRRGQTLEAMQYLADRIVNKPRRKKVRVKVDAGGYLKRREENLTRQALRLGEKVKKTGKPASFNPMSSHDRRIVHLALKSDQAIRTQSKGAGYMRKLVIFPRKRRSKKAS